MSEFAKATEPEVITEADAADLQRLGVLAMNPDRSLPLWFDGRFLTARDLNRQQEYFLSRHDSMGRSIGHGVIEGLEVSLDDGGGTQAKLKIDPGQGIAFDGVHILLPSEMTLNLSDLSVQSALNAKLGLSVNPSTPLHSRTGLFVLSLRAVEYTANQTTSFPTHVTGERTVHMGDKVEAVAATLTPYAPVDAALDSLDARASAAYRIFRDGKIDGVPSYALPLAMLSLRYGVIEWIDVNLVRRDLVASRRDFLGLGLGQDQLRLAHFHQYRVALGDVMDHYASSNQPARFPAEQHFKLLPAAGPVPADAVDPAAMAQVFFPGEVEVELSVIPDDELPALIEESFELPPIDLTQPVEDRDSLSVMIVAPMPRHALRSQLSNLKELTKPLKPLSMLGQGPQKPLDRLGAMKITLADAAARNAAVETAVAQEWAIIVGALTNFGLEGDSTQRTLWYMRRRTLRRSADLESVLVAVNNLDLEDDAVVPDPEGPVVEPEPVEPEPGGPTPEPEPQPELLPDEARAALLKLAGFGDLARIAEIQFRRVRPAVAKVFWTAVLETPLTSDAISTTAVVARLSKGAANASAALQKNVESILGSSVKGRGLLSVALIGRGSTKVSSQRFRQLFFFLTEDQLFEKFASAVEKLSPDMQKEVLLMLSEIVEAGAEDEVAELTDKVVRLAGEADRPTPEPEPSREPTRDPAAEAAARRDALSREKAKALIATLPEKTDQTRLEKILDKASMPQREEIVKLMTAAKVASSRIATGAALNALSTGGALSDNNIRRVRAINSKFVGGLLVLEPGLLKVAQTAEPAPSRTTPATRTGTATLRGTATDLRTVAVTRTLAVRPETLASRFSSAGLAAALAGRTTSTVNKRVALLAAAPSLKALAAFGAKHRRTRAKLNAVTADIVKALDASRATTRTVDQAIRKTLERNG